MISIKQLAEVIRDNIAPADGPLSDLYLDCAAAVMAAIRQSQEACVTALMHNPQVMTDNIMSPCETRAMFEARGQT